MRRTLLVAGLLLSPAAWTAPAPGPTFVHRGYLTRADLDAFPWPTPRVADERGPGGKRQHSEPGPGRGNGLVPALFLPRSRFPSGQTVPVFFLLRNTHTKELGANLRLAPDGPDAGTWNDTRVELLCLPSGKALPWFSTHTYACGGPDLLQIPPRGCYAVRAELGYSDGSPLPPGNYLLRWHCLGWLAETSFTVRQSVPGLAPPRPRPALRYTTLEAPGGSVVRPWREVSLTPVGAAEVADTLGVGRAGRCHPDPHEIPEADDQLGVAAALRSASGGEHLLLTLTPRSSEGVRLPERLFLCLQVEGAVPRRRGEVAERADAKERAAEQRAILRRPRTLEISLPAGWREVAGAGRLSVLVGSAPFTMPRREQAKRSIERVIEVPELPRWQGVLRTPVRVPAHRKGG